MVVNIATQNSTKTDKPTILFRGKIHNKHGVNMSRCYEGIWDFEVEMCSIVLQEWNLFEKLTLNYDKCILFIFILNA